MFNGSCSNLYQAFPWFVIKYNFTPIYENPAGTYLFKVNYVNFGTMSKISSKWTIKTSERRYWRRSGGFIVNFEQISYTNLVLPLLTLNK